MQKFIGVNLVEAAPMSLGLYNTCRGWDMPENENPKDPGYFVACYETGHKTWTPKEVFEKQNLPVTGKNNTVSQKDVDAMIAQIQVETIEPNDIGTQVTLVTVTLKNGFTITESSACVDPANYDAEIGMLCCMEKIEEKVWFLLGFLMSSGINGFQKGGGKDA